MAPSILTINGGSSSIKFALFETGSPLRSLLAGSIERIGLPETVMRVSGMVDGDTFSRKLATPDHRVAVGALMDWIQRRLGRVGVSAVGHRVVHGGPKYFEPQLITKEMVTELQAITPFDPEHLPEELLLAEAFHQRFPELPQVACFDTAFHHDLPRVAQLLPIVRRYAAQGVRRYGFHGLSYSFLMSELAGQAGTEATEGRGFLGVELDVARNTSHAAISSRDASRVAVRVVRTNEELIIASTVCRLLALGGMGESNLHAAPV